VTKLKIHPTFTPDRSAAEETRNLYSVPAAFVGPAEKEKGQ
jgi:hypothetical protein